MLSSFALWIGVSPGEALGAFGSILGGIIGAFGSAAAVFIMLRRQRTDEIEKVSAAILREVAELCKSPIGQLTVCAKIAQGEMTVPVSELRQLFHMPEPVVFPAVAGLIGRLSSPTLVVTFYMQLQETAGLVAVLEGAARPGELATQFHIQALADLAISQCQLARFILGTSNRTSKNEATLLNKQRAHMLTVLDIELTSALDVFPEAESFKDQRGLPTGIFAAPDEIKNSAG
jgi:hypothetical protein